MIIDTHVHIYDPFRPEGAPWPDPGDKLLWRTTLPGRVKAQAVPEQVDGVVVVEASERIEDNQWILDIADEDQYIVGLVGRLEPGDENFEEDLERFSQHPIFQGIRFWGGYFQDVTQDGFIDKMKLLAGKGLVLDVNFPWKSPDGFFQLQDQVPELKIVLEHVSAVKVNGTEPPAEWLETMRRAAKNPNTTKKVSALMENSQQKPAPLDLDYYRPALDAMWDIFGEDRLFFGSNWPVCEQAGTYEQCIHIVRAYFAAKGAEATEKFFWRNSQAVYGWKERR
jgi:L-fuconolactonase